MYVVEARVSQHAETQDEAYVLAETMHKVLAGALPEAEIVFDPTWDEEDGELV